jgi:hypothetical protein
MMTRKVIKVLANWLPIAIVTVGICLLVYAAVQQSFRQSANDPEIQMAEDAASALAKGATVETVVPLAEVDVQRSLSPFMIVYDDSGTVLKTSGLLNGQVSPLPDGVLGYTRVAGQDRVTWEPQQGVRMAALVVRYTGQQSGYVLAARSLREVEKREDQLFLIAGLAMLCILAASLVGVVISTLVGDYCARS